MTRTMSAALIALAATGCGWCGDSQPRQYVLDDAQLARVTEGGTVPTSMGCSRVCTQLERGIDTSRPDGAPLDAGSFEGTMHTCTLDDHTLSCSEYYCSVG